MSDVSFFENYKKQMIEIQKEAPELVKNFGTLFYSVMKEGALSTKTKELIALGIALAQRCEPCIQLHIQKAVASGCTKEEIIEAASVSVIMQGGPAYTHLPLVLETLNLLKKE
jgi:AhpD family alkylhydroperoxidase